MKEISIVLLILFVVSPTFTLHAYETEHLEYGEESHKLEEFVLSWYRNILKGNAEAYLKSIYWPKKMKEREVLDYKNELLRATNKKINHELKLHAGSSSVHERYAVVYIYFRYMHRGSEEIESEVSYLTKVGNTWKIYPRNMKPSTPTFFEDLRELSKHRFRARYQQTILKQNIHLLK